MAHILSHLRSFLDRELEPLTRTTETPLAKEPFPSDISNLPLKSWDKGVFTSELVNLHITPHVDIERLDEGTAESEAGDGQIKEGTYGGTQLALTEMYDRITRGYVSYFDAIAIESTIPQSIPFEEKASKYNYQPVGKDKYPPHLDVIPHKDQTPLWQIFNAIGLVDADTLLPKIVPKTFLGRIAHDIQSALLDVVDGEPQKGPRIADVERRNKYDRQSGTDIERGANIASDYADWYSDARFAQQQFTGTNTTTITKINAKLFDEFKAAATTQDLKDVISLLESAETDLYVQDCSYFREAARLQPDDIMISEDPSGNRFGCAAVSLFLLHPHGQLHPLAVCVDYRVNMANSIVIFNKRLLASDVSPPEKEDWPWRYAKTCAQVSDWARHEITVHLVNTHMIEEATIVATHRCIPTTHPVYKLLEPHWFRTLSLNAAARSVLVPHIIFDLVGMQHDQPYDFTKHAYKNFDFQGGYIPNDLQARGFPLSELSEPKFRNYAYAKNMVLMWETLRTFVSSMIAIDFHTDADVANDQPIQAWSHEIRSPTAGQIPTFPEITTVSTLVDAITMCIHIASPQHTAINYLQNYYQAFVINRPAALCTPMPTTLDALMAYKEADLVKALPINRQREWLLSAHIPHLLSYKVAEENNLVNYAVSLWNVYKKKTGKGELAVKAAAEKLYTDLIELEKVFKKNSDGMTEGTIPYDVMNPDTTAVSILL